MYYVYVLLSLKDHKSYVGFTGYLDLRLSQHNAGLVKSTVHRRPLKLIYLEGYVLKEVAERREVFLKSGRGREFLKKQLESSKAYILKNERA